MAMEPKYEWDTAKRRDNQAQHRVDFTAMAAFEWDTAVIEPDEDADELRWTAVGFMGLVLYFVVYTERGERTRLIERGERTRLISLRKATNREAKTYVEVRS